MSQDDPRNRLAHRLSILPSYMDYQGELARVSQQTQIKLLAAMGVDASTEAAARAALSRLEHEERQSLLPPAIVQQQGETNRVSLRLPAGAPKDWFEYQLQIRWEDGQGHQSEGQLKPDWDAESQIAIDLPASGELGYHQLTLNLVSGSWQQEATARWILCPTSCQGLGERLSAQGGFGLWTHLYSVKSRRNWGVGDLTDLAELIRWAGNEGFSFVGLNPLHALHNQGTHISPYSPISRLFRNPIYLDVESIPELSASADARARMAGGHLQDDLVALRQREWVDYERTMAHKHELLRLLHAEFWEHHVDSDTARGQAYRLYRMQNEPALTDFAIFMALTEHLAEVDWRRWPERYRRPDSMSVREFGRERQQQVDFHRYLQFEIDRQVAEAGKAAQLPLGLCGDLALGSAPSGYDAWANQDLFLSNVTLGAPPDEYAESGQDWGLPPMDPHRLKASGYRFWSQLLRSAMANAGALRLDHVMGLYRQFWIPAGSDGRQGGYVKFPHQDLLAILALESRRNGTVIIGEDLGTVPAELPEILAKSQVFSSQVLYFERDETGDFRSADKYFPRAMVTATTHDHPPLAGYWSGFDLELRQRLNGLEQPWLDEAQRERLASRQALVNRLSAEGWLDSADPPEDYDKLCQAVHSFLASTPSALLGIWLDDLAAEARPLNIPGANHGRYQNWSRRLKLDLADIKHHQRVRSTLRAVRRLRDHDA